MKKILFYISIIISFWLMFTIDILKKIHNVHSIEGLFIKSSWTTVKVFRLIAFFIAISILAIVLTWLFEKIKNNNLNRLAISALALILGIATMINGFISNDISYKMKWFEKNRIIAHAMGGIDSYTYTNSLEAFMSNYHKGHRAFEVDFCFTSDGILVAEHDWNMYYERQGITYEEGAAAPVPSYAEFMSCKLYNQYTPIDINKVVELMEEHEDIYIITDFKDAFNEDSVKSAFKQIVDVAKKSEKQDILSRIVVQIYHYEFYDWVDSVYEFDNYLFTCYMAPVEEREFKRLTQFCDNKNIPVITMWTFWLSDESVALAKKYDIEIFVHTENNLEEARKLVSRGASGIYTDFIISLE